MASFDDAAETVAAPEDVFKLLYDPAQFPALVGMHADRGEPGALQAPGLRAAAGGLLEPR